MCPICQELISYDKVKESVVFTPGNMIKGVFYGVESYYYHKDCIQNEEIFLYP